MKSEQNNILDAIYDYIGRFVIYPSDHARVAHTLWIAHTHLIDAFETTPRLAILSAEKQSGKTRLLEITRLLVKNAYASMNMTSAAVYTAADQKAPTILLDEVDRLFERSDTAEITALLNSGFQRGTKAYRCLYEGKRELEEIEAFCPFLMAGIDNSRIPDTILDRAITIRMERRSRSQEIEPYRFREQGQEGLVLRTRLEAWAASVLERAKAHRPEFPAGIFDRNADKWEALLTVADVSDLPLNIKGVWGRKARDAALALVGEEKTEEPTMGILLLKHIRETFSETNQTKISTEDLLSRLHKIDESPWTDMNGRPLNSRRLATMLKKFKISPDRLTNKLRGYHKIHFKKAWERYLDTPPLGSVANDTGDTTSEFGRLVHRLPNGERVYECIG